MIEEVILVDEKDNFLGTMEKIEAHEKGLLHRAFSIFIFNDAGELLLQQRALTKYHSAGLWTNTCCSHPKPGEEILTAANRRLQEEMGFKTELTIKTDFVYKVKFENNLIEHEFDYILIGTYNKQPEINREEVCNYKWINLIDIKKEIQNNPNSYTHWFKLALNEFF
ncbi:MAG: isopentenyl-diphosphate Delta-isomerase [Bacteroidia bacterium]